MSRTSPHPSSPTLNFFKLSPSFKISDGELQNLRGSAYRFIGLELVILVLDADHVIIAGPLQGRHNALPGPEGAAMAETGEIPRPQLDQGRRLGIQTTVDRGSRFDPGILAVHVEDALGQGLDGLHGVTAHPKQVAGVEIDSDAGPDGRPQAEEGFRVVDALPAVLFQTEPQALGLGNGRELPPIGDQSFFPLPFPDTFGFG